MDILTADRGLGGADHVCLVHDSISERMRALEGHVAGALREGRRVLVMAEPDDQQIVTLLRRTGAGDREGQLEVRTAGDVYRGDDEFYPEQMIARIEADKRAALDDGFDGLHIVSDMSWAARAAVDGDRLAGYERAAGRAFTDGRASAVCQYDVARFDARTLAAAAAAHPMLCSAFAGGETLADDRVTIDVGVHGTVRARGEVDMANAELLERALEVAARRSEDIYVDASGLAFVDVRGLRALLSAADATGVAVLAPPPSLRGMVNALGMAGLTPRLQLG